MYKIHFDFSYLPPLSTFHLPYKSLSYIHAFIFFFTEIMTRTMCVTMLLEPSFGGLTSGNVILFVAEDEEDTIAAEEQLEGEVDHAMELSELAREGDIYQIFYRKSACCLYCAEYWWINIQ